MKPIIATSIGNYYKYGNLEFRAEKSHKLGFDTVEMTMFEIEREGVKKCLDVIKKFGFKVTDMHASLTDSVDTKPEVFKKNLLKAIDAAKKIGTNVVTLHPGLYERDIDKAKRNLVDILKDVMEAAQSEGVSLAVENLVRWGGRLNYTIATNKETEWLLNQLPIGLLYDITHGTSESQNIYEAIENNKDRLVGLHVGDALFGRFGLRVHHLPIGEGDIDFQRLCDLIKDSNVFLVIELINNGTFEDLKIFKEKLGEFLSQ